MDGAFQPEAEPQTPSQELADRLRGQGPDFDEQTVVDIASMPFAEAFEVAFSYVTQAGMDAEKLLAAWLEPQEEPEEPTA
jgi:hypothetical protein